MLRLDGYIRVSRIGGREGEGYISPDVQREAITRYASELRGEIVFWGKDEDYTGGNTQRPEFEVHLARLDAGETDGLVVMAIDRFSRSSIDGLTIVKQIIERDQIFASAQEHVDPRTPTGAYMLRQYLSNAELFLDQIKESWAKSKVRAVKRGAPIGATPLGYLRVRTSPEKRNQVSPVDAAALMGFEPAAGTLIPDPASSPVITELFDRAATRSETWAGLSRWFQSQYPAPDRAPWSPNEVRRWVQNRAYLGEVNWGGMRTEDAHVPLTDPETFVAAQPTPGVRKVAHSRFLLSGRIRCANCRYSMAGQTYGGRDHKTPIYRCGTNNHCDDRSLIVASRLEELVVEHVNRQIKGLRLTAAEKGVDLAALDQAVTDAEEELEAFVNNLRVRKALGEAKWEAGVELRVKALDAARAARDAALTEDRFLAMVRDVEDLSWHELRDLLQGMIRTIFIRTAEHGAPVTDRAFIVWSSDTREIATPGPHVSGPFEPFRW